MTLFFTNVRKNYVLASKIYYHGRRGTVPHSGSSNIYITDDPNYALPYAKDQELMTYNLNFPHDKIFSIKNKKHIELLRETIPQNMVDAILKASGSGEIDWAAVSYLGNDEHEEADDLLKHLGFKGLAVQERTGIESLLVFSVEDLNFLGNITYKP